MIRLIVGMLLFSFLQVHAQNRYTYTINLAQVVDDKVKVTLLCPAIKENEAVFVMPRVIPGSYAWKEYGRFLSDVKAFDAAGNALKISNKKNIFYINKNAQQLSRIEYWVNDTWDDDNTRQFIFQPGGSNIEAGKNFVLNHHAFFGYFEGYKHLPFNIEVEKPEYMYGSTWLRKESPSSQKDIIQADNYPALADNPVMYCKPDTASFVIDQTRIYITSYSSKGLVKVDSLKQWLQPLALALKNFLGQLPVNEYHFMFYFASQEQVKAPSGKGLGGFGALEHNHSSFYYLPEQAESEAVKESVQDVASHEFLHILTPLNLHSQEIGDFNFRDPKMSQHLWMYEGVTEYFSWLVRVQNNLVTEKEFMEEMTHKLIRSDRFEPFSFTDMSKYVLESWYQERYMDVYSKGAVMAMLMDQLLIQKSAGKYSLKHLITDLMKKYGAERAFEDEALFTDIVTLTYPEVGSFIKAYIQGKEQLPLAEMMSRFAYYYLPEQKVNSYIVASFSYKLNENSQLVVNEVRENFIGIRPGDIILSVNEVDIKLKTLNEVWDRYFRYNPSPEEIRLKILRDGKEMLLARRPVAGYVLKKHSFQQALNPGSQPFLFHHIWLKGARVE